MDQSKISNKCWWRKDKFREMIQKRTNATIVYVALVLTDPEMSW